MTALQKRWVHLASHFGLDVLIDVPIDFSGSTFVAPVLLKNFGPKHGMVLVTSAGEVSAYAKRLVTAGYGFSTLGEPSMIEGSEASVIEVLRDWGWSGPGSAPAWLGHDAA
jgi:hypothetical protein